jgi:hypothetical protein
MTPDEVDEAVKTGVQVNPEPAVPNDTGDLFPPTEASEDGWKMVNFYVELWHVNGINYENINTVSIDVNYPSSFNEVDAPLFGDRADSLKFEIDVTAGGEGNWSADIVYPYDEFYPDGTQPILPSLDVRQLVYNTASDAVDVDADGTPDVATPWNKSFLDTWGTDRVAYGEGYDSFNAFELYQTNQSLVLEITGWMWFHQPGVDYPVSAICATYSGATSDAVSNVLGYERVTGLYCDFDSVQFTEVVTGGESWAPGDRCLDTLDKTTVWNNGNVGAEVGVWSTKMVKDFVGSTVEELVAHEYYDSSSKTIETFDAKLVYCDGAGVIQQQGQILYPAEADPLALVGGPHPVVICNNLSDDGEVGLEGPVLLQQCRPAKIEFSVHPESGQLSGNYAGFLFIEVGAYTGIQLPTL